MEEKTAQYMVRAYVYSGMFHAVLIMFLMNIRVLFEVEPPKFYELNLGTISRARIEQILDEARRAQQAMTPEERINVPERKMIDIEEPTISVPAEHRIESRDIVTNARRMKIEVNAPVFDMPAVNRDLVSMDRKENFQGSKITVGEQPGTGIEARVIGADEAVNFVIDGELEGRKILSNPLPAYPEGLNRNATIRIAFEVFPDGSVSNTGMVPVRKENAVLEELAMNSLKLWRFSPLPEGNKTKQKGIITFVFKVQ